MSTAERIRGGDIRLASRLIRNLEDKNPRAREVVKELFPWTGRARVLGLTGAPGAGKSTITDHLISSYRATGHTVGVLAVDPTSPFSGGAILGDRVRMQKHAEDKGVFIRSLATRGALGGLAAAVDDAVHVLDAMGMDRIILETVGTGQSEVDVMNNAHTVLLALTPGLGDEVQTLKAGIMEIADLFLINKADQKGASKLYQELMRMLNMVSEHHSGWRPPVLMLRDIAHPEDFAQQVEELRAKIDEHYQVLVDTEVLAQREYRKARLQFLNSLRTSLLDPVVHELEESGELKDIVQRIADKRSDPHTLADELRSRFLR
ncbi:MAG: methylmalonyl Co-A mutase-associated GTPase MeaB [Desulfohalobiaceae bacterium]|nr:methylmalonyl Co-A mutase-associated GTPase MeaB [Desulfohalobiaceae bacterium]